MNTSVQTFRALDVFVCYNAYGDRDDMTDEECEQWGAFVQALPDDSRRPPNHISATEVHDEFAKCEVTGVMGSCTTFEAVWL